MSLDVVHGVLFTLAIYLGIGFIAAVPMSIFGLGQIDPATKNAPWTFRVLILPGVVALWPLLVRRLLRSRRGH